MNLNEKKSVYQRTSSSKGKNIDMQNSHSVPAVPRVSVCLALYNGEKFIREQIESILSELCQYDEVIICDDASTDGSCSIIQAINDSRITLIRNTSNIGYVKNFEKAISLAKGDIIFLSDQDDIWVKGKVKKVLTAFQKDNDISLVYHNIKPINASGNDLQINIPEYSEGKRNSVTFLVRQLIKPQIYGCACCLNRKKIDRLLPFPVLVYEHDHWIAVWAAINGQIYFLRDKLVKYRRHESNVSPQHHFPLTTILRRRFKLAMQIFTAIYRRMFGSQHGRL